MKESDQFHNACDELTDQIVATANAINTRFGHTFGAVVVTAGQFCIPEGVGHTLDIGTTPPGCGCLWLAYMQDSGGEWGIIASTRNPNTTKSTETRLEHLPVVDRVRCAHKLGDLIDIIARRKDIHVEAVKECSGYLKQLRTRLDCTR